MALTYITVLSLVPLLAFSFALAKGLGLYGKLVHETIQPLTCAVPMELLAYWCMVHRDVRPFYADIQPIATSLTLPSE